MSYLNEVSIIVVTPTYNRPGRLDYCRRMIQRLNVVHSVHVKVFQILIEDGACFGPELKAMLERLAVYPYVCLAAGPTRDGGNVQRNHAYEYIVDRNHHGVVYNLDDDNDFKPVMFRDIASVRRVGVLPVGNLGPNGVERAIVVDGVITGWDAGWLERKFPVDMAGFAFKAELLRSLDRPFWQNEGTGGESEFLGKLATGWADLEVLTDKCMVWHNEPLKRGV